MGSVSENIAAIIICLAVMVTMMILAVKLGEKAGRGE